MPQRPRKAKQEGALDGARFVRPGFAYLPDDDLAFALGYPHRHSFEGEATPMEAEVARTILARSIKNLISPADKPLVEQLEAQVGPEVVVEALVEALERYKEKDFHSWNRATIQFVRWGVGFALLRCPAAVAAALRARLQAIYVRAKAVRKKDQPRQVEAMLDVVLHGAAGAERSGHRYEGSVQAFDLLFVHDDPAYVLAQVQRHKFEPLWRPWARLAFLGGEPVVKHYASNWRKIRDTAEVRAFVRDFGKIRSPAVRRAIREIAATPASPAVEDAAAWLRDHPRAGG